MKHYLMRILWATTLLVTPWSMAQATQQPDKNQAEKSEQTPATYDNFDHAEWSKWQGSGKKTSKVKNKTLLLRQIQRFKHMPLLSTQVFDLDLASQQHPIDLTIQLVSVKGNHSNLKEHNNFELGWVDEKGKTLFAWRWEFLRKGHNQAHRIFNGKAWNNIWWTKAPQTLFAEGNLLGLRVTDTAVQMLRNGKMIRSALRPANLPHTDKCRIYLSFKGPKDQASLTLDNVSVKGIQ